MPVESATSPRHLRPPTSAGSITSYIAALWTRREYIVYVASSQLRAERMNTFLGNLWFLLNPILQTVVAYLVFGVLLEIDRGVDNFVAFLTVGIFVYQFTQRATMQGAKAITGNAQIIRSFVFPRAMLPLTSAAATSIAFAPMVLVMLIVPLITGEPLRWTWVAVVPLIGLQVAFNVGASFVAARAAFHVPDLEQLLPFVFRLGFYASGVLYLVDEYVDSAYRWVFLANPMYGFLALYRWAILGIPVDPAVLPIVVAMTGVLVTVGFLWFRSGEIEYARG